MQNSNKYQFISHDEFTGILAEIVKEDAAVLLTIPGAYELFAEHYHNEVLNRWEEKQFGG